MSKPNKMVEIRVGIPDRVDYVGALLAVGIGVLNGVVAIHVGSGIFAGIAVACVVLGVLLARPGGTDA